MKINKSHRVLLSAVLLVFFLSLALWMWFTPVHSMEIVAENITQLTTHPAGDCRATWSPDGSEIAFTSWRSGAYDVWVMDADGTNKTQLTNDSNTNLPFSWSPDGSMIAYSSISSEHGTSSICVIDPDGGDTRCLVNTSWSVNAPDFSPDSSKIVFVGVISGIDENKYRYLSDLRLSTVDIDGSNLTMLRYYGEDPVRGYSPHWYNSTTITYATKDYVWMFDLNDRISTALIRIDEGRSPQWTGDRNRLTYFKIGGIGEVWGGDIWIVDADGTNRTLLAPNPAYDECSELSYDGKRIAWGSERGIISDLRNSSNASVEIFCPRGIDELHEYCMNRTNLSISIYALESPHIAIFNDIFVADIVERHAERSMLIDVIDSALSFNPYCKFNAWVSNYNISQLLVDWIFMQPVRFLSNGMRWIKAIL